MSENVWDDPELLIASDFVKFETVGDTVTGTIRAIKVHRWEDGTACPELILDCGADGEKSLTAGQVRLKAILAEKRPNVGDVITVTFTELEKRSGGKTLKHFDVVIGGVAPAAAAPPAADGFTAEQLAAMKLLGVPIPS
jgi:hypothetical protein